MLEENKAKKNVKGKSKLTINNELKIDAEHPIPIQYGSDSFYTANSKRFIPYLNAKNNLPNLLLEARLTSPTHNACITTIADATIGSGLFVTEVEGVNKEFTEWCKSVNRQGQSLNDVLKEIVEDERTHGNKFIEIVKVEVAGKKFLRIHLHSMLYCRLGSIPKDSIDDLPVDVIISKEFSKRGDTPNLKAAVSIPIWYSDGLEENTYWKQRDNGSLSTMLHFKNRIAGIDYYGLPASAPSLRNQVIEGAYAQYNLDNIENNMVLGGMLIFKSGMTQEEAQLQRKEIILSHTGKGKTGRIAVLSSEQGIDEADFKPYNTQKEGSFVEADKHNIEKIISSHNWDGVLAGITRNSSLGSGSTYIRAIWDVKEATLLKPLRKTLIDNVVKPIVKIWADWFGQKDVLKYEFDFKSSMPYSFISDIKPEQFVQVNEARKMAGMGEDKKQEGKYLAEMTKNTATNDVQNKPTTEEGADNN